MRLITLRALQLPDDETTRSQVPGIEELRTARLIGFDQEVELVDGAWEGPPYVEGGASRPALNLLDLDPLSGDLDGDGLQEAVSIVSQTSGGTGNNLHLVAFVHACRIGDREGEHPGG